MPTKKPRISITLEKATALLLTQVASHESISVSSLAKELIIEALEQREDRALSVLADARDQKKEKRVKNKDAWREAY